MTARLQAAPASGTLAGVYDITASPYNATTGAADNSAAIQAAINAAKAAGGMVYVPPGIFKFHTPLNCDQPSKGFSICGANLAYGELLTVPSELRYTGSGAGPAISCHTVYDFGLRGLEFTYDNSAGNYTGDFVDIDGGPHGLDCTNWVIEGCGSHAIGSITARSMVRLSQAINGEIRNCGFSGAGNEIRYADSGGPYVVGVRCDNCTFNNSTDAHILFGTAGGENNVISFPRFEAGNNTTAIRGTLIATDGGSSDNAQYSLTIRDPWCGDAGTPTTWFKNLISQSNQYPCEISGGRFASTQAGTHLTLKGRWMVRTCSFDGGTVYDSIGGDLLNLVAICNYYNTPSILFNATRFPAGYPQNDYVSLGNSGAENAIDGRIGIKATSGTFGAFGTQPGDIILGARTNSGYEVGDAKAKVYYSKAPSLTRPILVLQAPYDGADGMLSLVAGAGPAEVIRIEGAGPKIGFYGVTAVVQAARAGQLTDSTGGVVSSTLAAGIADAVAKNAIASLAAKVNALELAVHNVGLTA